MNPLPFRIATLIALAGAGTIPARAQAQSFTLNIPVRSDHSDPANPVLVPEIVRVTMVFESDLIGADPEAAVGGALPLKPATPCTTSTATCTAVGVFGPTSTDVAMAKWVSNTRFELTLVFNSDFVAGNFCNSTRTADRMVALSLASVAATRYRMASYSVPELQTAANPLPKCDVPFRRVSTGKATLGGAPGVQDRGRLPLDVILVLDKSGSMGWQLPAGPAGTTRWQRLQASVGQFMGLWKAATAMGPLGTSVEGSMDDRIGLVFFDAGPQDGILEAGSIFKKRDLSGWEAPFPAGDIVSAQVATRTPGGATSMGAGVERAKARWDALAASDPNDLAIVVFTDGEQNTAPLIEPDPGQTAPLKLNGGRLMDLSTPILTIGLGAASGPFADRLNQMARETAGQSRISAGGLMLDTNFTDMLVAVLKGNTLSLMARTTGALTGGGPGTPLRPFVDGSVARTVFVLGWEGQRAEGSLGLRIRDPNGVEVQPSTVEAGPLYVVAAVDIPQSGPPGEWQVQAIRVRGDTLPVDYHLSAYAVEGRLDYRFTIVPAPVGTGEPVRLRVELGFDGQPLEGIAPAGIRIYPERPRENLGNLLANSPVPGEPRSTGGESQSPVGAKIEALAGTENLLERIEPQPLAGVLTVREAGGGLYEAPFDQTIVGGKYRFRIELDWNDPRTGRIRRTELVELQVPVLPTPAGSRVEVHRDRGDGLVTLGGTAGGGVVLLVTPGDRFGNLVGPGYDQYLSVQVSGPATAGVISDPRVDGTYVVPISGLAPGADPRVTIGFRGRTLRDAPLSALMVQGARPVSFGIRGGVAVPHGTFDNEWDPGFAIDADLEYAVNRSLAFQLVGGYRSFTGPADSTMSIMRLSGNVKLYLGTGGFRPFVNGGAGVYFVDPGDTSYGGNVGAGLVLGLSSRLGLEAAYNYYVVKQPVTDPTFSTVEAGLRLRL